MNAIIQPLQDILIRTLQELSQFLGVDMMFSYIGFTRVVIALIFFAYIGYSDWTTRRIKRHITGPFKFEIHESIKDTRLTRILHTDEDGKWRPGIPTWTTVTILAFILLALEMTNSIPHILWPRIAANIAVATIIGFGMYHLPNLPFISDRWKLFHSGDLKALLVIGILIPTYPFAGPFPVFRPEAHISSLFIISVLQWTAVLGIVYAAGLTANNIRKSGGKFTFPASILGYKVPTEDLHKKTNRRVLHREGKLTFDGLPTELVDDYLEWRNSEDSTMEPVESFANVENVNLDWFLMQSDWGGTKEEIKEIIDSNEETPIQDDEKYMQNVAQSDEVWVLPDVPLVSIIAGGVALACLLGDPLYMLFFYI